MNILDKLQEILAIINEVQSSNGTPLASNEKIQSSWSSPLLLEAVSQDDLHRYAIDVHAKEQRWAFVNLNDLKVGMVDSFESLKDLGNVTLFIEDLGQLSIEQQIKLAEYLARSKNIEPHSSQIKSASPMVIAGIYEPMANLIARRVILPTLLQLFSYSKLTSELLRVSGLSPLNSQKNYIDNTRGTDVQTSDCQAVAQTPYLYPESSTIH